MVVNHRHSAPVDERAEQELAKRRRRPVLLWTSLALLVCLGIMSVGGPAVGRLAEAQRNDNSSYLPNSAESSTVNAFGKKVSGRDDWPYFIVVEKDAKGAATSAPMDQADLAKVTAYVTKLPTFTLPKAPNLTMADLLSDRAIQPVPSADGKAVLIPVFVKGSAIDETIEHSPAIAQGALAMREGAKTIFAGSGMTAYVTGFGGFMADFSAAFAGIDGILLVVALIVVLLILLVVYRSPLLPLVVLASSLFGLCVAALIIRPLAKAEIITLSGMSQGILFILVVGAATDYALLLVSRYREELHDHPDALTALNAAWRASLEPIAASAATVALGLLCLLLSDLGNTRGLGPVGAIGVLSAFVSCLTFLPAMLLLLGRAAFWPKVPRVDHVHSEDVLGTRSIWGRVSRLVGAHPRRVWVVTFLGLAAAAVFVPQYRADGVAQNDYFRTTVESVQGDEAMGRHFPQGFGSPIVVVAPEGKAEAVATALRQDPQLSQVFVGQQAGQPPKVVDGAVEIQATMAYQSESPQAQELVRSLRTRLDTFGEDVLVGGVAAINADIKDHTQRDLRVIIPAVLLVIVIVLGLLLRSLVAPLILLLANLLSFGATIGVSALLFNHVFNFPGSDALIPLYAFVFLVALGIDYSIFLMTRVREEVRERGPRDGVLVGLAVTGAVITSAGVVLASTFSALVVIPMLFLVQMAFIVAFGVLLDTMIVRSLLVPALSYDLGRWMWWPSKLSRSPAPVSDDIAVAQPERTP